MSMTLTRSTNGVWDAPNESNADREPVSTVVVPEKSLVDDLLERLVVRSTSPTGLDRETLRSLDDVWGVSED